VRELIRHILKENRAQQELKQVIKNSNIFDAADLVGGIPTLKKIFKDDPEMSSLFEKLTGTITFYYPVIAYEDIEFPLNYEIIGRHSNVHKTNHWPEINVLYDENKLTPEENEDFKSMIKVLVDEVQHSSFKSKIEDGRIFNTNYFTVKELNGENIDLIERGDFSMSKAEELHDKFYGDNQSLNESTGKRINETEQNISKKINIASNIIENEFSDVVRSIDVVEYFDTPTIIVKVETDDSAVNVTTWLTEEMIDVVSEITSGKVKLDYWFTGNKESEILLRVVKIEDNNNLNESSIKEKSLINIIENEGLYDFIEMTGLDFNQVRSLIKQMDNPKEILKQYIRQFVIEKGGSAGDNIGALFAIKIPISNTKRVEDILVQDSNQIAVEIWDYEIDEYGHREQTEQYLTSINNLTNEELISILWWMMETIKDNWWD
jgi:hypothetical protein